MILQAIEQGEKLEKERLHLSEIGIAQLTAFYYNSQKTKPPYKNVEDFCFFKPRQGLPEKLCNTFRNLLDATLVPAWCAIELPIVELENGATDGRPATPRLYSAPGIFLVAPEVYEETIVVAMAAFDEGILPGQYYLAFNVDNRNEKVRFWLPQDALNVMFDVEFDIAPTL